MYFGFYPRILPPGVFFFCLDLRKTQWIMKGLIICASSLVLLLSCEKYSLTRVYRAQVLPEIGRRLRDTSSVQNTPAPEGDTTLYISAVSVPDSYDWRRDTSYGGVPCELVFLKNGQPVFTVTTGAGSTVSSSPETHHILDGHLYTEYNTASGTVICRDGAELFSYQGREILRGLALHGGALYTLGRDKVKGGVVLRRDGEIVLRQEGGTPFGDFSSFSRSTGALYEDSGKLCFCFKTATACYMVVDGEMRDVQTGVNPSRVADMRIFLGQPYYVVDYGSSVLIFTPQRSYAMPTNVRWKDPHLAFLENRPYVAAINEKGEGVCKSLDDLSRAYAFPDLFGEGMFIYPHARRPWAVSYSQGNLKLQRAVGDHLFVRDSSFFFGPACACMAGESIFLAVTPREEGLQPFVWHAGTRTTCALNGYITGIDVQVSPPS